MRSTLFFIPHEVGEIPILGFGWALLFLAIGLIGWVAVQLRAKRPMQEVLAPLPFWLLTGAVIVWVMPSIEARWPDGSPIGLPIRGYGVMVLTGLLAGISLCVLRGKKLGVSADTIIGLGFWMMLGGVLGARLFYVVQKWDEFDQVGLVNRLIAIVKLTEGGLVIYGGVFGGLAAGTWFCLRHKLPLLSVADLVAPGFLAGYSFGRIGCLLHGCCFGGICTAELPAITFPHGSGPYHAQLATGDLLGIHLAVQQLPSKILSVTPGSWAEREGLQPGDQLKGMQVSLVMASKERSPTAPEPMLVDIEVQKQDSAEVTQLTIFPENLPDRSLPVHPSQIYAAINAALLCGLIWLFQPIPRRDGIAFLAALLLYAISRFLLEGIRSDEAGQLGTFLTISQLIAIATAVFATLGMIVVRALPPKRQWGWQVA